MIGALLTGVLIGGIGFVGKEIIGTLFKDSNNIEKMPSHACIPSQTWEELWFYNKVYVQEDKETFFTPFLLEEYEMDNGTKYFFKLPLGIVTDDLMKCETQIRELFDVEEVKIYHYKENTAMVELIPVKEQKKLDWADIWNACGVSITDKERKEVLTPVMLGSVKDKLENPTYKLKAPLGISLAHFTKSREYLKDYLQARDIKFESLGGGEFSMSIIYNVLEEEGIMIEGSIPNEHWAQLWKETKMYSGDEKVGITLPTFITEGDILGGKKYTFKMPFGKSTHDLNSKNIAIQEFLDAQSIKIVPSNKREIEVHAIYEKLPRIIPYEKVKRESKDVLEIVFGRKIGDWIRVKLTSGENGILINGMAGSGKSNLFKGMILDLALNYSPNILIMYLVDTKVVELAPFRKLRHVARYVTEIEDIAEVIDDLTEEMTRRYKLFDSVDVENIYAYNQKVSKEDRLPFVLFAIEEISAFTVSEIGAEGGYNKKLAQLNYRSRACGYMNIFCVQRMTNANIPREVSNSLGVRPSLKVADAKEAELITGTKSIDLSKLKGFGNGYLLVGGQCEEFQSFKIEHKDIKPILKQHNLLK